MVTPQPKLNEDSPRFQNIKSFLPANTSRRGQSLRCHTNPCFPNPNRTVDALVGVRWLVEITIWRGDKREPPTCCEGTQSLLFLLNDFSFSGWLHFRLRTFYTGGCFVGDFALQKMVVKPSGEWMPKEDLDDLNGCSYSDHSWGGSERVTELCFLGVEEWLGGYL